MSQSSEALAWPDAMTLDEVKAHISKGEIAVAVQKLTPLAKAYPANQEIASIVQWTQQNATQSPKPVSSSNNNNVSSYNTVARGTPTQPTVRSNVLPVRWLYITLLVFGVMTLGIILALALTSKPDIASYKQYSDDRAMVTNAAIGERVRFSVTLTGDIGPIFNNGIECALGNSGGNNPKCKNITPLPTPTMPPPAMTETFDFRSGGGGLTLNFKSLGKRPDDGTHVFFGKVTSRQDGYLYIDVEQLG